MTQRQDFLEILRLVRPASRVLDIGCGSGELLALMAQDKAIDGRGLEISPAKVATSLGRGLAVVQGDADKDLDYFPASSFDYAVLSQTLQATRRPRHVLSEMLRIADRAVVSFPNFGHWRVRWDVLTKGRMPKTQALPEPWWSTPNIHLCTLRDFLFLCEDMGLRIEACSAMAGDRPARPIDPRGRLENWRAETALFLLTREAAGGTDEPPIAPRGDLFAA